MTLESLSRVDEPDIQSNRTHPDRQKDDMEFRAGVRAGSGRAAASRPQWVERTYRTFTAAQRAHTKILIGGLTAAHDQLLSAALAPLGYQIEVMRTPDNEALEIGKAYCDRAMCNPAYYVVGNLLRCLTHLRDQEGLTPAAINQCYVSVTANGCGPCRYGLYMGQFRRALRETGFEGFRVLDFDQTPDKAEARQDLGLDVNIRMLFRLAQALILGDVVNLLKHRIRPYELTPGETDAAVARNLARLCAALKRKQGLCSALRRLRRELGAIPVDRSRVKPKVAIIGEIWAQTTEGEGNYRLPAFLEGEGAEVETQPLTTWILSRFWEPRYDLVQTANLLSKSGSDGKDAPHGLWWKVPALHAGEGLVRLYFSLYARLSGLRGYALPSVEELSRISAPFYDPNQKGGEMFMEVGKLLQYASHSSANLVVSVKPFGCMPSSAVSDGVQSIVTERNPRTLFLSIETTGDGEVNVQSRVQMQLFKATQAARGEAQRALDSTGITQSEAHKYLERNPRLNHALHHRAGRFASRAANIFEEIGLRPRYRLRRLWRRLRPAPAGPVTYEATSNRTLSTREYAKHGSEGD